MAIFNITPLSNGDLILLVTAVIVLIYTVAAQKSNELQEKPILEFGFKPSETNGGSPNGDLYVRNIGRGPAYNISFGSFSLNQEGRGIFNYNFFLPNPSLKVGEEKNLRMWVNTPDGGLEASDEMWLLTRMNPPHTPADAHGAAFRTPVAVFLANYKGINGKTYHSIFHFYNILPPVGEMIMQFVEHGTGKSDMDTARSVCGRSEAVVHAGLQSRLNP